jgi:hypothetical protein
VARITVDLEVVAKDEFFPEDGPEGAGRLPEPGEVARIIGDHLHYDTRNDRNVPWMVVRVSEA